MTDTPPQPMHPRQLVWRCRRGIRELDVLFGGFLETQYPTLSDERKLSFELLLEEQDPLIMDWLFGRSAPDNQRLIDMIGLLKRQAGL